MNKLPSSVLVVFLIFTANSSAQNIAINSTGAAANASAMLDIESTTSGTLITRMTQAQRNAIASPATGLLIYQTDAAPGFYYYNGTSWVTFSFNLYTNTYQLAGTAAVTANSTTWQICPGLTTTFTLTQNAKVFVTSDGGVQNLGAANTNSLIDIAIHNNGGLLNDGGFKRICAINTNATTGMFEYWSASAVLTLTPGTYTIDTRTRKSSAATANATVSGNNTTVLQGMMTVQIIYQ
jgi:hypothetical protein